MDNLEQVSLHTRLQKLLQQHGDLDSAIARCELAEAGDPLEVRRLKKLKLHLKDEIVMIQNCILPDIIA